MVDLGIHGLQIARGRTTREHPLLDFVAASGSGGDPFLELPLAGSEVVHLRLDAGQFLGELAPAPLEIAQLCTLWEALTSMPELIETGVVVLDLHQCVERLRHPHSSPV